jgi:hypothetical protein
VAEEKDRQVPSPGNPAMDPASLRSLGFKVPEKQTTMLGTDVSSLGTLGRQSDWGAMSQKDVRSKWGMGGLSPTLGPKDSFKMGTSASLGTEAGKSAKTELASARRDLSGGGAKSAYRARISNFSAFGRGTTYGDYMPSPVRSGFYSEVISSMKHFVPEYGLFGAGYSGGPMSIMPFRFQGAHPMINIAQYGAASSASTYHNGEDEDE